MPAPANIPGARQDSISWIDSSNNLWLFGGNGISAPSFPPVSGSLNDLWKYNTLTGLWTWVSGSNLIDQPGVYGTKGVPAASNVPGARGGSISWIDSSGNLWLFGGYYSSGVFPTMSIYRLNDLWKFTPSTGLWTWISGSSLTNQAGVYGIKGMPNPANTPGSRADSIAWIDSSNNLWFWGGSGYDSAGSWGDLNDLWKFNSSTGLWTWMSGSNLKGQTGIYGTKGVPHAANIPGARSKSICWTDHGGNFWLFGGYYYLGSTSYEVNDLWRYNSSTGLWTWMSGSNLTNRPGIYGTKGIPSSANIPGARMGSVSWFHDNDLWLFGGNGYDISGFSGHINDLWKFTCEGDPGDLNGDCVVDMEDLGILAQNWLDDYTLVEFKKISINWYSQTYPD